MEAILAHEAYKEYLCELKEYLMYDGVYRATFCELSVMI